MEKDLASEVQPKLALNLQAITSNDVVVGNILDTKGFESVDISFFTKTVTDGDYALALYAGDEVDDEDNPTSITDEAAVDADNIIGTLPAFTADTDDDSIKHVGCVTKKRWILVKVVPANVSSGVDAIGAIATFGHAASRPTS